MEETGDAEDVYSGLSRAELKLQKLAETVESKAIDPVALANLELELFVSIACHDLQSLLRKLLAYGEAIDRHAAAALDEESRGYLGRMNASGLRMKHLLGSLAQFAKGSTSCKLEPTDLGAVLTKALSELEVELLESKAKIEAQPLPTIDADPVGMRYLFENLISSSLRQRKTGEPPLVVISSRMLEGGKTQITLGDNGLGFSQSYLDRAFGSNLGPRTGEEAGLTGIELAICRKIVSHHRGEISGRSNPGQGAVFTIRLPVKQA